MRLNNREKGLFSRVTGYRYFDCDCQDEFGNAILVRDTRGECTHKKYNPKCKKCKEVYDYLGCCENEGYSLDFNIDTEWEKAVEYYDKYYGYEPEYD